DAETLEGVVHAVTPTFEPNAADFDADATRLAYSEGHETFLLDVATGRVTARSPFRASSGIDLVRFSPDGTRVALASVGVHVLRTPGLELDRTVWDFGSPIRAIDFGAEETVLAASGTSGRVVALDGPRHLRGHRSFVNPVAISPDGRRILTGGW